MRKFECCADRAAATAVSEPPPRVACQSVCWKSESESKVQRFPTGRTSEDNWCQEERPLPIQDPEFGLEVIWNQKQVQRFPNVEINDLIPKKKAHSFSFDLGK